MSDRTTRSGGGGSLASISVRIAIRIGLIALLVGTMVTSAGVVAAGNHDANERAPCPYENENQGVENANETGLVTSLPGIETAAGQICD